MPNKQVNSGFRKDGNPRMRKMDYDALPTEPVPRVLPKDEDPRLVKRNRRMLGQLLGTLEKFREEDKHLSSTEAYMRRSDSLRRAEEKAREESERLRQQEREQIAEKRRRDLTLRARVAAKAEQKKMELLFILWSEHHKKLSNFLRTKTEPPIYYMPVKPLIEDAATVERKKEQVFHEWKTTRRAELSEYQKQIEENYISNVDEELEKWQSLRNRQRSNNNNNVNLQETMDKELETHRLEHGPKPRRIPGSNDEEEDVEDIVAEDELMDEVLGVVAERVDGGNVSKLAEGGNASPNPVEVQ
ncbi:uncharacterized protein A4U43_C07F37420 [Asparagus officinalis]|uniref:Pinin/SDK/MemA protein domain-containing protein n=2 Tax=Asparagus officinalis TaxID=4686 RepID=A0A5P1EHQ7_ASPOF|nr:uncharacterized protein A4U43_C07F37420 [Asparagus officinalis]